jgi:hypothetical protein
LRASGWLGESAVWLRYCMFADSDCLLLHVDPPIKEIIRYLNEENSFKFVLRPLEDDPNKIVVSKTFDGKDTVPWLQEKIDKHLEDISFEPSRRR